MARLWLEKEGRLKCRLPSSITIVYILTVIHVVTDRRRFNQISPKKEVSKKVKKKLFTTTTILYILTIIHITRNGENRRSCHLYDKIVIIYFC